jgi:P27 family predicted phage terminase small subunit
MRGRKPKPTHLRVIEGNPGKRAINRNEARPPVSAGLAAPAHIGPDGKREWRRVARQLEVLGLLASIDRGALAAYCAAYGLWADAQRRLAAYNASEKGKKAGAYLIETPGGAIIQHPLVGIVNQARKDVVKFAAEFGMTPSARSRVDVRPEGGGAARAPASKFSGLVNGRRQA